MGEDETNLHLDGERGSDSISLQASAVKGRKGRRCRLLLACNGTMRKTGTPLTFPAVLPACWILTFLASAVAAAVEPSASLALSFSFFSLSAPASPLRSSASWFSSCQWTEAGAWHWRRRALTSIANSSRDRCNWTTRVKGLDSRKRLSTGAANLVPFLSLWFTLLLMRLCRAMLARSSVAR